MHRAEATLTARDVEVSAIFTFDDLGRFVRLAHHRGDRIDGMVQLVADRLDRRTSMAMSVEEDVLRQVRAAAFLPFFRAGLCGRDAAVCLQPLHIVHGTQ